MRISAVFLITADILIEIIRLLVYTLYMRVSAVFVITANILKKEEYGH